MRLVTFLATRLYSLLLMSTGCFGSIVGVPTPGRRTADRFGTVVGVAGGFTTTFGFGWVWSTGGTWVSVFFANLDVCLGTSEKDGEDVVKARLDRACCWNKRLQLWYGSCPLSFGGAMTQSWIFEWWDTAEGDDCGKGQVTMIDMTENTSQGNQQQQKQRNGAGGWASGAL